MQISNHENYSNMNNPSDSQNHPIYSFPVKKKTISWLGLAAGIFVSLLVIVLVWIFVINRGKASEINPFATGENVSLNSKTVQHPITGIMYTPEEASSWADSRPLGVMINNFTDARPQWGISKADVVYEIVAEGGITRYLAFFLTEDPEKIGPVRSTREYYLVLVKELGDAMIMHIGWSPQALEAIETWPVRSLGRGGASFERDLSRDVAIEHTAYVDGKYLRQLSLDLGWEGRGEFQNWKFKDDNSKYLTKNDSTTVSVDFWDEGDYSATFKYVPERNSYLKYTGFDELGDPVPVLDDNDGSQAEIKNVVIQFVSEASIVGDDKSRLEYELVSTGEGLVFMDGKVIPATWSKAGRDDRTIFYDGDGAEIEFNRGKFWISIVPDRNVDQVKY